jgi:hypothetical protein
MESKSQPDLTTNEEGLIKLPLKPIEYERNLGRGGTLFNEAAGKHKPSGARASPAMLSTNKMFIHDDFDLDLGIEEAEIEEAEIEVSMSFSASPEPEQWSEQHLLKRSNSRSRSPQNSTTLYPQQHPADNCVAFQQRNELVRSQYGRVHYQPSCSSGRGRELTTHGGVHGRGMEQLCHRAPARTPIPRELQQQERPSVPASLRERGNSMPHSAEWELNDIGGIFVFEL